MDIRITQTIVNRIYSVNFVITPTDDENKLINKFGDPDVNYGGVITKLDTSLPPVEVTYFTLPDNWRKLRAGTNWTQKFDGSTDALADSKAVEYARNVKNQITTVVATLRANVDTFTTVATTTV